MFTDKKAPGAGSLLVGEGGMLLVPHVATPSLHPVEKFGKAKLETLPALNHYHDWVDAILAGKRTTDGFHYAGPLTETVQLGNIATRVPGKRLEWDVEALKFRNSPEADKLVTKQYRKGFEIAG